MPSFGTPKSNAAIQRKANAIIAQKTIYDNFTGKGGINQVLTIAFPMIISQGAETVMLFVDRLFLARLSPTHLAAAMSGGLTTFTSMTFFIGVIGYVNALVSQYLGAKRSNHCGLVTAQGLFLAIVFYPIICATVPLCTSFLKTTGHSAEQYALESVYLHVLAYGSIFGLLRIGFGSFFSGIGRTRIVMGANLVAMMVNVIANYAFIFGKLGCPNMGMKGAAYGTVLGSAVGVAILAYAYFGTKCAEIYGTRCELRLHLPTLKKLLIFGCPAGIEFFLNIAAFNAFVQAFHSYGKIEAAAMTITFSWDLVAFLPMTGIGIAVTSLVGRYMGAKKPELAVRSTYSAFKIATTFSIFMTVLFIFIPQILVKSFIADVSTDEYAAIVPLASTMLRIAAAYTIFNSTFLTFSGAIRGAGDTKWALWASMIIHWTMAGTCITLIYTHTAPPITVWCIFACLIGLLAVTFFWRFKRGRWKKISMVDDA